MALLHAAADGMLRRLDPYSEFMPGADYASFAAQAVTFPAASPDGTTVDLQVQVLDDGDAEGPEFLAIALSGADLALVSGGGSVRHVLSITDDEAPPSSAFGARGGEATIHTELGGGTEVELVLPRGDLRRDHEPREDDNEQ